LHAVAVFVALLAVVAIATRASSPTVPVFGPHPFAGSLHPGDTVSVVGDSITVVARPDIDAALESAYHADVHGIWGQRIDEMLPTLAAVLGRHPSAVVVNLGTNDVIQAQTHPDWQTAFGRMIAMLAPEHCVLLTTIDTRLDRRNPPPAVAAEIDSAITNETTTHGNFHIVDWNAAVHATNGASLLSWDGIHPSPAGQLALGARIRSALDRDCRDTPA
jgi:hypothetical protein